MIVYICTYIHIIIICMYYNIILCMYVCNIFMHVQCSIMGVIPMLFKNGTIYPYTCILYVVTRFD